MKTWLKENIVEILAAGAVFQFLIVILFVLFREVKSNETTTMMILTSSTNIVIMVLQYYFGSSKTSKDKDKVISNMQETANEQTTK